MPRRGDGKRNEFLDKLGYIKGAPNRRKVLILLDGTLTPSEVAKKSGLSMNIASRSLRQMEKEGIVRCETPKRKKGRLYTRTKNGERIARECAD